jgi:hypothetical protein
MNSSHYGRFKGARRLAIVLAAGVWSAQVARPGLAQYIALGPPSFQADAARSYDTDLLNRLALTGQYEPEDPSRLAWLSVLQSFAMQADVDRALPWSPTRDGINAGISALRSAADSFYADVSPTGPSDISPTQQWLSFDEMQLTYSELGATFADFPGLSNRAAMRLFQVGRMIDATNFVMSAIAADALGPTVLLSDRVLDLDMLKRQSRLAANDLVALVAKAGAAKLPAQAGDDPLPSLNELWTMLHDFNQSLALSGVPRSGEGEPPGEPLSDPARQEPRPPKITRGHLEPAYPDIVQSLRAVRRQASRIESTITRLQWPADLLREWRKIQGYINGMSDEFGLTRSLDLSMAPRPRAQPERTPAGRSATRIYRGSP